MVDLLQLRNLASLLFIISCLVNYTSNFKEKMTEQTGLVRIQLYAINQTFHSCNSKRTWQWLAFTVPADVLLMFPKLFEHPTNLSVELKGPWGQPKIFLSSFQIQQSQPGKWHGLANKHSQIRAPKKCIWNFQSQGSPTGLVRN